MKTIAIPEDLHRELISLKLKEGNKNAAELIAKLISEYKKKKLDDFSSEIRERMQEKGLTLQELLRRSRKIREEIANERFSD